MQGGFVPYRAAGMQAPRSFLELNLDWPTCHRHRKMGGVPDELDVYANYRNTYKPAAIDFGPDVEGGVLLPETAQSGEV